MGGDRTQKADVHALLKFCIFDVDLTLWRQSFFYSNSKAVLNHNSIESILYVGTRASYLLFSQSSMSFVLVSVAATLDKTSEKSGAQVYSVLLADGFPKSYSFHLLNVHLGNRPPTQIFKKLALHTSSYSIDLMEDMSEQSF